jgi:hypothetical protein
MLIQLHKKLGTVNADIEGWADHVREHIESGTNFILILSRDPDAVTSFCRLFGLPDDCTPRTLTQADFFLLSQFIEPEAFDAVLHHWDDRHQMVFVEQIDFEINRPPKLKHFLVYSPVLGILAQHELLSGAKELLAEYQDSGGPGVSLPEAGVYCWERKQWCLFEGR